MLALEKRMDGGNTAVHVNNQADLCDVLRTMETLVTECEKNITQMKIIVNHLRKITPRRILSLLCK